MFFAALTDNQPKFATLSIALGALYATVLVINLFGVIAAVMVQLDFLTYVFHYRLIQYCLGQTRPRSSVRLAFCAKQPHYCHVCIPKNHSALRVQGTSSSHRALNVVTCCLLRLSSRMLLSPNAQASPKARMSPLYVSILISNYDPVRGLNMLLIVIAFRVMGTQYKR